MLLYIFEFPRDKVTFPGKEEESMRLELRRLGSHLPGDGVGKEGSCQCVLESYGQLLLSLLSCQENSASLA